jgi:hypothetical protein
MDRQDQARRTQWDGRALKRLRDLRRERREQAGKVRMQIQADKRSASCDRSENVNYAFGTSRSCAIFR